MGSAYKRVYFDLHSEVDAQFTEECKRKGVTKKSALESLITDYVETSKHEKKGKKKGKGKARAR